MTTTAEKRALVGASKRQSVAASLVQMLAPAPPGESGTELTGAQFCEALSDALLDLTGQPRVKFANVRDIDVRKVGRWVIVKVKSKGAPNELTFRINIGWAKVLRGRLSKALDSK